MFLFLIVKSEGFKENEANINMCQIFMVETNIFVCFGIKILN